jgi:CheY-like chemotaxis protein
MGKIERSAVRQRSRSSVMSMAPSAEPEVAPPQSVLVVEADPDLQSQIARVLRKLGLRVVATGSGSGALALLSEWDVNLILVSESLPGRSGIDVVREIQRVRPGSRVLMVTSHPEPRFSAAARTAGALGCVVKPLAVESLMPWLSQGASSADMPRLAPTGKTRSSISRRPSALPLTNSAHPTRGAVAE